MDKQRQTCTCTHIIASMQRLSRQIDKQTGRRNGHTVETGHNGGLTAITGIVIWTPDGGKQTHRGRRKEREGMGRGEGDMRRKRERLRERETRAEKHAVRTTENNPSELFHLMMSSL